VPGGLVAVYDQAFVTMLDEGVIEESVAILGHGGGNPFEGWEAQRLRLSATVHDGRTEDAEACDFTAIICTSSAHTSAPRTAHCRRGGRGLRGSRGRPAGGGGR